MLRVQLAQGIVNQRIITALLIAADLTQDCGSVTVCDACWCTYRETCLCMEQIMLFGHGHPIG